MKNNEIKEVLFGPEKKHELTLILGKDKLEQIRAYNWHYIVYIELKSENKIVLHHSSNNYSQFIGINKTFINLLEEGSLDSATNKLLACTLFPSNFKIEYLEKKSSSILLPKMIEDTLFIGNGHLIYYQQLESIYSLLTNGSHAESYSFRRDWNLKKDYTREIASKIQVMSNYTLLDLILEKSLEKDLFVYQGNFHGAYCLTNYLDGI